MIEIVLVGYDWLGGRSSRWVAVDVGVVHLGYFVGAAAEIEPLVDGFHGPDPWERVLDQNAIIELPTLGIPKQDMIQPQK